MHPIDCLPPLRETLEKHGLQAKKTFGQNFLFDLNLTHKISHIAALTAEDTAIEIGPGPGGLTRALLKTPAHKVLAIEIDPRAISILEELKHLEDQRLTIIQGDALAINLVEMTTAPRKIIANLPYNVATPLLIRWLKQAGAFKSMTLMFQKEVAERITAHPGSKSYGRLSVMCQAQAVCRRVFDLPPSAFIPSPKVTSSVVHLIPHTPVVEPKLYQHLETVTKFAFGQRRKMLRSSLKGLNVNVSELLEKAGIESTQRAEELSLQDFLRLAKTFQDLKTA
ncbi:MAG: 16S rRNA (adenine(1518)-N(6)/adenine(1519)-N(6))-dimethyltransferase RsmA [Candidatus Paracaedimonas acanthamoebae]|uniref:Ribosomal RNA small subunit methyltransferase A n=1 Tax=Candidatus Paracaedimonas acanthamoebae TaxID=244581 RepID=A0A8J7PZL0_9PROT|nr:16S rRNA (adenine(1518)-N(6)/adenine(1519)-N(6))-dimethyltransferase RsmA [Candidatus Paracaedimonas acanthamoebae]